VMNLSCRSLTPESAERSHALRVDLEERLAQYAVGSQEPCAIWADSSEGSFPHSEGWRGYPEPVFWSNQPRWA
jgi:hypothetical protein